MRTWLRLDARNRAFRTLVQGVVVAVLAAVGDAVLQVVQRAAENAVAGQPLDWRQVAVTAGYAAGTAALMAVTAYLHRARLDPSPIPSAQPPRPPGASAATATATTPVSPLGR